MARWFVAGAAGMLGQDLCAVLEAAGHAVTRADLPGLDILDPAQCVEQVAGPRRRRQQRRLHGGRRRRDRRGARLRGQRRRRGQPRPGGARAPVRAMVQLSTDYVVAGDAARAVRRRRAGRAGHRLRPHQGGRGVGGAGASARAAGSCARRGSTAPAARTSRRPCSGSPGERERLDRRRRPGRASRPGPSTSPRACVRIVDGGAPFGIWHATGAGECSWFELARAVFEELGLDPERVSPISTDEFPLPGAAAALQRAVARHVGRRRASSRCRTGATPCTALRRSVAGDLSDRTPAAPRSSPRAQVHRSVVPRQQCCPERRHGTSPAGVEAPVPPSTACGGAHFRQDDTVRGLGRCRGRSTRARTSASRPTRACSTARAAGRLASAVVDRQLGQDRPVHGPTSRSTSSRAPEATVGWPPRLRPVLPTVDLRPAPTPRRPRSSSASRAARGPRRLPRVQRRTATVDRGDLRPRARLQVVRACLKPGSPVPSLPPRSRRSTTSRPGATNRRGRRGRRRRWTGGPAGPRGDGRRALDEQDPRSIVVREPGDEGWANNTASCWLERGRRSWQRSMASATAAPWRHPRLGSGHARRHLRQPVRHRPALRARGGRAARAAGARRLDRRCGCAPRR